MEDKELYEMYHNTDTKAQAQEIAVTDADTAISKMMYYYDALSVADRDDIAQECRIAILQALNTYDYSKCAWATWRNKYIKNAVYMGIYKAHCNGKSKYMQDRYNLQSDISIYAQGYNKGDKVDCDGYGMHLKYEDIVDNPIDIIIRQAEQDATAEKVKAMIAQLTPTQQYVMIHTYGLDGTNPMSDVQMANAQNVVVRTIQHRRGEALDKLRRICGAQKPVYNPDKTGVRITDRKGRTVVVVRYGNCRDIDAVMRDNNSGLYYLIRNAPWQKVSKMDVLRSNCNVSCSQIDADTTVYGKCANAYF